MSQDLHQQINYANTLIEAYQEFLLELARGDSSSSVSAIMGLTSPSIAKIVVGADAGEAFTKALTETKQTKEAHRLKEDGDSKAPDWYNDIANDSHRKDSWDYKKNFEEWSDRQELKGPDQIKKNIERQKEYEGRAGATDKDVSRAVSDIIAGLEDPDWDETWEQMKDWVGDCIPCMDRFSDLGSLLRGDDLWNMLEADLTDRLNWLDDIAGLFSNTDFMDGICDIIRHLMIFRCLPDFAAILAILASLKAMALDSLKLSISGVMWDIIGQLLQPFLSALDNLIRKMLNTLFAPIECIIDALMYQMTKIPIYQDETIGFLQSIRSETGAAKAATYKTFRSERTNTMSGTEDVDYYLGSQQNADTIKANAKARQKQSLTERIGSDWGDLNQAAKDKWENVGGKKGDSMFGFSMLDTMEDYLSLLTFYLSLGWRYLLTIIKQIELSLKEILEVTGGDNNLSLGDNNLSLHLLRLARLIGLVIQIIRVLKDNELCPEPEDKIREVSTNMANIEVFYEGDDLSFTPVNNLKIDTVRPPFLNRIITFRETDIPTVTSEDDENKGEVSQDLFKRVNIDVTGCFSGVKEADRNKLLTWVEEVERDGR